MTIKEFAEQKGISAQAVYQRLNQHHISLSTLKNADTGEITADGEAVLTKLFNQPKQTGSNQLKEEYMRLKTENASLQTRVEELQEKVRALEADKAYFQAQATELLTRIPPALPAPGQTAQAEKRGLLARIFGK